MKKLLITGGTGTISTAFVRNFYNDFEFHVLAHSEKRLREFLDEFPEVPSTLCSIESKEQILSVFSKTRPDIVVHAAAIKHVDFADKQPITTVNVNVLGSINVISASQHCNVPITIALSTDKASNPQAVYGCTKFLMEKCFLEADQASNCRFAVCRFGNVMGSAGSVIPIWRKQASEGLPLGITDERMKRFMFSEKEAVGVIRKAIEMCEGGDGGFVLSKMMKVVSVVELAKCVSQNIKIIGIRPGERLHEFLINAEESRRSSIIGDYIRIGKEILQDPIGEYSTETAIPMSQDELIGMVRDIP